MTLLPKPINEAFLRFLLSLSGIEEFEQWVYANAHALEQALSPDDYLALLSISYAHKSSTYNIMEILNRYVDPATVATHQLNTLLRAILSAYDDLPQLLLTCYKVNNATLQYIDNR